MEKPEGQQKGLKLSNKSKLQEWCGVFWIVRKLTNARIEVKKSCGIIFKRFIQSKIKDKLYYQNLILLSRNINISGRNFL